MLIYTATSDFYGSVRKLFSEHTVEVFPRNGEAKPADIIVFTGGEDIMPSFYGMENPPSGWFNRDRDIRELKLFNEIFTEKVSTKKVLGLCRGLQLINVGLGGTLIYDIEEACGVSHDSFHELNWQRQSPLSSFFPTVNSLHHQAMDLMGESLSGNVLATEPKTGTVEIAVWAEKYLAVQFHPEFMTELPTTQQFVKCLEAWVNGNISLNGSGKRTRFYGSGFETA